MTPGLKSYPDGFTRCWWCGDYDDYIAYHDEEWGHPVKDDNRLFEKICLEGFQSGLSWLTILRKRDNFRKAFNGFRFEEVAHFGEKDVERLLQDPGIVRHRKKIESTINNAKQAVKMKKEFGSLGHYFWRFEPSPANRPTTFDHATLSTLAKTDESIALSKDLKKRGWSFIGPTTAYAFMQAMGMVNDHLEGCAFREVVEEKRRAFQRP
ncbi:MAG: DNA-3-methyladenine glycosylase I [Bacteroidota bacterium]